MTTPTVKEEIDQVMSNLRDKMPNFRDRPAQKIMIAEIAKTFWLAEPPVEGSLSASKNLIAIEAPTGTGKSQSYLLPSILVARRKKKKLVVSSATVKLQQQLCETDLPRLNECIEGGITYAIAKGRSRYVCALKLEKEAGGANQISLLAESNGGNTDKRDTQIIQFHKSLQKNEWDGDRDNIKADDSLWADISTDSNGCLGNKCAKYKECAFFMARAQLDKVDVIVTNHDLLLSDLYLGGGVILTAPEDTFYVIDEAHHLPDKTLGAFSSKYAIYNTLRVLEKMSNEHAKSEGGSLSHHIHKAAEVVHHYMKDLSDGLEQISTIRQKGDVLRFPFGTIPDNFMSMGNNILSSNELLVKALSEYHELLSNSAKDGETNAKQEKELMEISIYLNRASTISSTWQLICQASAEGHPPIAKWIEVVSFGDKDIEYMISASPVSAALTLKKAFWDKALGVVLTSATLTALNSFNLFLEQSGLSLVKERVKSISLPSPFDYPKQGTLVIPKMAFSPKDVIGHTNEVIKLLPAIYPKSGGMLVLFTSRKQMTEVRDALPVALKALTMMQGDTSLSAMIEDHKQRIKDGYVNVMLGLSSMAEGVDLPGDLCVRVVVVKLPFDVPNDPISKSFSEWLESNGRNSFNEISLPAASRKLAQYSGRLIRTETDIGEIYCLDNRLSSSRYGADLIKALPPYKVEKNVVLN